MKKRLLYLKGIRLMIERGFILVDTNQEYKFFTFSQEKAPIKFSNTILEDLRAGFKELIFICHADGTISIKFY